MLNNIIEKRTISNGLHRMTLEISAEEYNKFHDQFNNEIASEIVNNHLVNQGDDGRPSDIQIQHENGSNIVQIIANIHYLGNDHTSYKDY